MAESLKNLIPATGGKSLEAGGGTTLVASAYHALRRDIIEGRLAPGTKLRVEHLKDQYKVGAGTLREALALLATDALVVAQGQRGFRVIPISIDDFHDITETRVQLECNALRLSMRNGRDEWEGTLTSAFHMLSLAEQRLGDEASETFNSWEEANRRFHAALIGECHSRWTQHFLSILYNQAERYRRLLLANRPLSRNVHEEHRAIFEAAIARDEEAATEVLARHIRFNCQLLKNLAPNSFNDADQTHETISL